MGRKWEYSRGTKIVAVQGNSTENQFRVLTLIARPGTPFSACHDTPMIGMYWARYTGRQRYFQYGIHKKDLAEGIALREAHRMGIEYVPGIKEWDSILTLEGGLIEALKSLEG